MKFVMECSKHEPKKKENYIITSSALVSSLPAKSKQTDYCRTLYIATSRALAKTLAAQ